MHQTPSLPSQFVQNEPCLDWFGVGIVGLGLSLLSCILSWLTTYFLFTTQHTIAGLVWSLGAIAMIMAPPLTHGLAGKRKFRGVAWAFFQPLQGGTKFIVLQGAAWALYSVALLSAFAFLHTTAKLDVQESVRAKIYDSLSQPVLMFQSVLGLISQILVLLSLNYFDHHMDCKDISPIQLISANFSKMDFPSKCNDLLAFVVTTVFYTIPLWSGIVLIFSISFFWGLDSAGTFLLAVLSLTYLSTYIRKPHHTGRRAWSSLKQSRWFFDCIRHYFDGEIILADKHSIDPNKQYLFGFAPHGVFPASVFWSTLCSKWSDMGLPSKLIPCGASVVFYVPIVRDICLWLGARDVSRATIHRAFDEKHSVILVPGGQQEVHLSASTSRVYIVAKHKGFVRVALQRGVALVPVLSFGENMLLDLVRIPFVQRWFHRRLGFVFPVLPYGRWFLPIPRRHKISIIVGTPIHVPIHPNPPPELVEHYHSLFYHQVRALFDTYKTECGYPDAELVIKDA